MDEVERATRSTRFELRPGDDSREPSAEKTAADRTNTITKEIFVGIPREREKRLIDARKTTSKRISRYPRIGTDRHAIQNAEDSMV